MVRIHDYGRRSSLLSIDVQFPKLDVAGSIPVSRSKFSRCFLPTHRERLLMRLTNTHSLSPKVPYNLLTLRKPPAMPENAAAALKRDIASGAAGKAASQHP